MNIKQQVREAEMKLRRCEAKAKTRNEEERCLRQYKIDVLRIKEPKAQPQPTIKDTDLLLVNRGGVDYKITAKQYKEFVNTEPGSINNEDLILVNQLGVDYKTTAADLKVYLNTPPPKPWDDFPYPHFHLVVPPQDRLAILVGTGFTDGFVFDVLTEEKLDIAEIKSPGEYMAGGASKFKYSTGTWDFGPLTDLGTLPTDVYMKDFLERCSDFDGKFEGNWVFDAGDGKDVVLSGMFTDCASLTTAEGMGDWDVSKVADMRNMFKGATNFNADLSQWCVSKIGSAPRGFNPPKEEKNKPVWGTCPRGEDQ